MPSPAGDFASLRTSPGVHPTTVIDFRRPDADSLLMEPGVRVRREAPEPTPPCVVCGRDAVTIDREDAAMCAKHAAMFVTRERRDAVAERGRIVR